MFLLLSIGLWVVATTTLTHAIDVTLNISSRPVLVHLPPCLSSPNTTVSLLLSLHALGSTAKSQSTLDHYGALSDNDASRGRMCAVIVYPQGKQRAWGPFGLSGFSWNAGGCCPNETKDMVDDVSFIQEVIEYVTSYVRQQYHHRSTHTFLVGVSNGGMMANRLACELNFTSLRAFAAVSGPLVLQNDTTKGVPAVVCDRVQRGLPPVPLLHIHGLRDPIVPFGGCNSTWASFGEACVFLHARNPSLAPFPDVPTYVDEWRRRNGQKNNSKQTTTFENNTVTCVSTGEKANNVTLCTASEEGHSWPGGNVGCSKFAPQLNCTNDIDASVVTFNFFESMSMSLS